MRNTLIMLGFVFACLLVAPMIPPLAALDKFTIAAKTPLLTIFISAAIVGGITMIAAITELNFRLGQVSTDEEDISNTIEQIRTESGPTVLWRQWKYKFTGKGTSSSFDISIPFSELKAAYRTGRWREDPVLLRVTLVACAAFALMIGLFGTVFTLCPVGLKLSTLLVVIYAAVRMTYAWQKS